MSTKIEINNFDVLRLTLSCIVFFYHADIIFGSSLFSYLSGKLAVKCFFVVSGYLIVKSYINNPDLGRYLTARAFRVYPLYALVIFITISLASVNFYYHYGNIQLKSIVSYLLPNLFFVNFVEPTIFNLFENNHNYPLVVNGSLWTLKIEVAFYLLVPLIYRACMRRHLGLCITAIVFFISAIFGLLLSDIIESFALPVQLNNQLPTFLVYFMGGAVFNFFKIKPFLFSVLFLFSVFLLYFFEFCIPIEAMLISILVMYIAIGSPINFTIPKKVGDLSYFIYLFHFPMLQTSYTCLEHLGANVLIAMTFVCCVVLAWFSWHYFEKPMISYAKTKFSERGNNII